MQNSKAKFIQLLALSFCVMFSGCLSARSKAPRIKVTTPSGTEFNQAGDVKTPPVVNTSKTCVEIPIPAQSQIVVTPATLVCAWYLITKKFDLFPKAKR